MKEFVKFYDKYKKVILVLSILVLLALFIAPLATTKQVKRNGIYVDIEDVALYIKKFHELPSNFLTKDGYEFAISHNIDYSGKVIGGDSHFNQGQFTNYGVKENVSLKECDVYKRGYSYVNRGKERLVYTTNVKNPKVFYTTDHYSTFVELDDFHLQLTSNIIWIFFGIYLALLIAFYTSIIIIKMKLA